MGWWNKLFKTRAEDWVFQRLKNDQVPEDPKSNDVLSAGEAYLTITLRSMRVVNVRKLATKFYGVVHSFITIDHLSGKDGSFQTVTTPSQLRNIDSQNVDHVIQVNKTLLGPIPYRGGQIGLELGLFSVKEADLAAPFLDVLQSMASQAGVGIVSAALPFAEPIKKGIEAITGTSGDSILEIGVATDLNPPTTGWWVVMRAPKETTIVSELDVTPTDFRLVNKASGELVKDYPYLVFTVTQSTKRSDWFKLPDLTKPYQKLQDAVRDGDYNAAKDLITTFKRLALTSDDLITDDAKNIGKLVQAKAEEALGATLTSAGKTKIDLPPLESYQLY
ncbi:MAG TPA: hypothetical protein VIF64_11315 [Pyrinomonadaceae bacterium]